MDRLKSSANEGLSFILSDHPSATVIQIRIIVATAVVFTVVDNISNIIQNTITALFLTGSYNNQGEVSERVRRRVEITSLSASTLVLVGILYAFLSFLNWAMLTPPTPLTENGSLGR